jgi:hypothetical protein
MDGWTRQDQGRWNSAASPRSVPSFKVILGAEPYEEHYKSGLRILPFRADEIGALLARSADRQRELAVITGKPAGRRRSQRGKLDGGFPAPLRISGSSDQPDTKEHAYGKAFFYSMAGERVPAEGWEVRDGGWQLVVIDPDGFELGGDFAGLTIPAWSSTATTSRRSEPPGDTSHRSSSPMAASSSSSAPW